jgi:hypothetical protein
MRADYINPFIRSLDRVFQTMVDCQVHRGQPFLKVNHLSDYPISGVIGLSGQAVGTVVLSLSARLGVALRIGAAQRRAHRTRRRGLRRRRRVDQYGGRSGEGRTGGIRTFGKSAEHRYRIRASRAIPFQRHSHLRALPNRMGVAVAGSRAGRSPRSCYHLGESAP